MRPLNLKRDLARGRGPPRGGPLSRFGALADTGSRPDADLPDVSYAPELDIGVLP